MEVEIRKFGELNHGSIDLITFTGVGGQSVSITNYGGIVHEWKCRDREGVLKDILLGCKDLEQYHERHPYFNAIVGRYANRIANGRFSLDGKKYVLSTNLPPHHLHGGIDGFDRKIWEYEVAHSTNQCTLKLHAKSNDMEEGYPGNVQMEVHYTYTEDNELIIHYRAVTDRPTPLNLTNHCYFNLSGDQNTTILDHAVCILADGFTATDDTLIPTGHILPVQGTPLDFTTEKIIGQVIDDQSNMLKVTKGFDHNFVITEHQMDEVVATVCHSPSGRRLRVFTDRPGIQFYTGNWLGGVMGKPGKYQDFAGLCLETQYYPDSPNRPEFPDCILKPGDIFDSVTIYKIDTF